MLRRVRAAWRPQKRRAGAADLDTHSRLQALPGGRCDELPGSSRPRSRSRERLLIAALTQLGAPHGHESPVFLCDRGAEGRTGCSEAVADPGGVLTLRQSGVAELELQRHGF